MSVEYGGSLTLRDIMPIPGAIQLGLVAALQARQGDLAPQLAGLTALSLRPPPSIPDLINAFNQGLAALSALLANPLPDVGAVGTAIADLQGTLAAIGAQLSPALSFGNFLNAAGIHAYFFAGQVQTLGPELGALLSSGLPGSFPSAQATGVVLLATDAGAVEAIRVVFPA